MNTNSIITDMPVIAPKPRSRTEDRRKNQLLMRLFMSEGFGTDRRRRSERRATPRINVELECEERQGASRYFRITTDLSTFGLATRQGAPQPKGTPVNVLLYLPDGQVEPVELRAEVIGSFNRQGGMRLAFRNPSLETVRRIHRYLSSRL